MREIKTWKCEYCGQDFKKVNTGNVYKFCSRSHAAFANKPSQALLIPEGEPMSARTMARRKKAAGLTKKWFYPFNESFFETWSDDLAWLIGLIWTDGNLSENTVEICSKDKDLIQTVADLISQEGGVRPKNKGAAWRVVFTSKKVNKFLKEVGLTEAKSFTVAWPLGLPEAFEGDFVRGVIDGDGSVLIRKARPGQKAPDLTVSIVGASKGFIDSLAAWLDKQGIRNNVRVSHHNVFVINVAHQDSLRKLYGLIYPKNENTTALQRKYQPFRTWLDTPRVKSGRPKGA
jgi:hypothetical protein